MSDSLCLYRTIIDWLRTYQVQFQDIRCLIPFAWSIVGVIQEKSVHMSKWSIHRQGEARAASKQRQFSRWLKNVRIEPGMIYQCLARAAFGIWQGQRIYLALDTSCLWGEYVLVRLAVIYRGRALPVSWVVLRHASAMVGFEDYQCLLDQAAAILPHGCQVVLLADRGFDDNALLCKARDLGWSFCVRLRKTIRVYRVGGRPTSIRFLMPAKGQALFVHKVWITNRKLVQSIWPWPMPKQPTVTKIGPSSAICPPVCTPSTSMPCASIWKKASWTTSRLAFRSKVAKSETHKLLPAWA